MSDSDLPGEGLTGADGPRPLPEDLVLRLVASLSDATAGGAAAAGAGADDDPDMARLLAGLDAPRALPAGLATRLVASLAETSGDEPAAAAAAVVAASPALAFRKLATRRAAVVGRAPRLVGRAPRLVGIAAAAVLLMGVLAAVAHTGATRAPRVAAGPPQRPTAPAPGAPRRPATTTTTGRGPVKVVPLGASDPVFAHLEPFDSCADLLQWTHAEALATITPYGSDAFPNRGFSSVDGDVVMGGGTGAGSGTTPGAGGSAGSGNNAGSGGSPQGAPQQGSSAPVAQAEGGTSRTNVQEAGADEPDFVKAGNGHLYVLRAGTLDIIDTGGARSHLVSRKQVLADRGQVSGWNLFLDGTTLVVLATEYTPGDRNARTRLIYLDVANPASPVRKGDAELPGSLQDARSIGGRIHTVASWQPGPFVFTQPTDDTPAARQRALRQNQSLITSSGLDHWLPPGLRCEQVRRPRELAGFSMTVVASTPISHATAPVATAVLADAGTVYATGDRLVVATTRWQSTTRPPPTTQTEPAQGSPAAGRPQRVPAPAALSVRTDLHLFSLDPDGPHYLASGSAPGVLKSSYSIDFYRDSVRVATTDISSNGNAASVITVLGVSGSQLRPIGSVGGIGAGERIQGVRFLDDVAFGVTFLQTDPLHVVDLSDPTRPRVRGILQAPGFSGYLHPLGGGLLLGVGVDANTNGRVTGGAVSVYDVHDLDHPRTVARLTGIRVPDTISDPHAFLYWAPTGMLVLPSGGRFEVVRVSGRQLRAGGTIDDPARPGEGERPYWYGSGRAFMADGGLYTVSPNGVAAVDPASLHTVAWVPA